MRRNPDRYRERINLSLPRGVAGNGVIRRAGCSWDALYKNSHLSTRVEGTRGGRMPVRERSMSLLDSRASSAPQGVGKPVRRVEDERLVTGAGCFSDDFNGPDQGYAWMVR